MWNSKTVSIVLATYREKESIRKVVEDFFATGVVDEVIVVDNNAETGTQEEVKKTKARLVKETKQGYGYAFQKGIYEAKGDYVILCEPDGTFLARDLSRFLESSKHVEVVLGSRTRGGSDVNVMNPLRRLGNVVAANMIQILFHVPSLSDIGCTYKLFKKPVLDTIQQEFRETSPLFATELTLLVMSKKVPFREISVVFQERVGISSITSHWYEWMSIGVRVYWYIGVFWIKHYVRQRNDKD